MKIDMEVITALLGIGGIVLAALMSSAGYLYRNSTEHKKSARKVLYLLLEIRQTIIASLFDPDEATDKYFIHYVRQLNAKGIEVKPEEVPEGMRMLVSGHFNNVISSLRTDIESRLLVPFEEALLELASVDPVLAYQLRGKEKLEKIAVHTRQYQSNVNNQLDSITGEEWAQKFLLELSDDLKEEALDELSETINADVMALAKACGWFDYWKCKAVLANSLSNKNKYNFDDLDKVVDKLMAKLVVAATKQLQGS